jgi:hypothetical protein
MFVLHIELKKNQDCSSPGKNPMSKDSTKPSLPRRASTQRNHCAQTRGRELPPLSHLRSPGIAAKVVATDLHQELWAAIADQCAEFSVQGYSTV